MPSGVPSPPTLGQPFALLSYPASGLLLFTRQTLFTQRGLAACLQRIGRISWTLHDIMQRGFQMRRAGPCAPVALVRQELKSEDAKVHHL